MIKTLIAIIIIAISQMCLADRARTNINEISDLFAKEIEDKGLLEQMIEESKSLSLKGESGDSLNILGTTNSEVEQNANELNSISANDLENRGNAERAKEENNFFETLEVDYSSPQVIAHRKDIDLILDATDRLLARLLDGLRDLDIDCKEVKGDKIIEPELYLDIKKEELEDTKYNQHLCEELRNRYNCRDTLTMTCKTQGMQYGEWQNKEIHVAGGELINAGKDVFYVDHVAKNCFEFKLILQGRPKWWFVPAYYPPAHAIHGMREFLATKHENATIDNIGMEMSSDFNGGISSIDGWTHCGRRLGSKDYMWNNYIIRYKYREGKLACFEWSEEWNEACNLQ